MSESGGMRPGPLAGIRILELAHYHMGPGAGLFLADMGADVIHVESPPPGDGMRDFNTLWGFDFSLSGNRNSFTEDLVRNKRSLSVDLRTDDGRALLHQFVAKSDIFLTNLRQAALDKNQMDYETLRTIRPELIYCQGSGYGAHGPMKDSPGNEMMGLARGGLMLGSAPEGGEPVYPSVGLNDRLGSIGLAMGVLAALVARERTGVGQLVHTSLLGWSINLQAVGATLAANTGQDARPARRESANDPLYNYYQCKDGVWVALGMVIHKDHFWPLVCDALQAPELATEARFNTVENREKNAVALVEILSRLFARLTFDEWDAHAQRHDFIATRVNTMTDLATDPQVLANGYIERHPHPEFGEWLYVATPLEFSETPVSIRRAAPQCGENSVELVREWLGLDDEEIDRLTNSRVI